MKTPVDINSRGVAVNVCKNVSFFSIRESAAECVVLTSPAVKKMAPCEIFAADGNVHRVHSIVALVHFLLCSRQTHGGAWRRRTDGGSRCGWVPRSSARRWRKVTGDWLVGMLQSSRACLRRGRLCWVLCEHQTGHRSRAWSCAHPGSGRQGEAKMALVATMRIVEAAWRTCRWLIEGGGSDCPPWCRNNRGHVVRRGRITRRGSRAPSSSSEANLSLAGQSRSEGPNSRNCRWQSKPQVCLKVVLCTKAPSTQHWASIVFAVCRQYRCLLTADVTDDDLVKPEGIADYAVPALPAD